MRHKYFVHSWQIKIIFIIARERNLLMIKGPIIKKNCKSIKRTTVTDEPYRYNLYDFLWL